MSRYSFSDAAWEDAKEEAREILIEVARNRDVIAYSELAARITKIQVQPESYALHHLIGEISAEENAKGRGMLSVLVVQKETRQPGQGFFALAKDLGRGVVDQLDFFVKELNQVYKTWAG
jgi:plasmid stability protein